MASTMWSVSLRAAGKSAVNGTFRFLSCVDRRYDLLVFEKKKNGLDKMKPCQKWFAI